MNRILAGVLLVAVAVSGVADKPRPGWLGIGYTYHRPATGERFLYVRHLFIDGPAASAMKNSPVTARDGSRVVGAARRRSDVA